MTIWQLAAALIAWLAVLMLLAARLIRRLEGMPGVFADRRVLASLAALLVLLAVGFTWGLPGPSWAPDEIDAASVRHAVALGFSGGWSDKYPPFHFAVLALAGAPAAGFTRTRLPLPIGLALLSYYVTLIVPAGYVYDRFLMPALLLVSPVAAAGLAAAATAPRR